MHFKVNNELIRHAMFCHRRNGGLTAEDVKGKTEATNNWMVDLLPTPIYMKRSIKYLRKTVCVCECVFVYVLVFVIQWINIFSIQMAVALKPRVWSRNFAMFTYIIIQQYLIVL